MALPLDKLGTVYPERVAEIDPERAVAYGAKTNNDNPAYQSGKYAPPVFGVVPVWDAIIRGMTDGDSGGPDKPDHTFPPEARDQPVASYSVHVDDDQTFRYRDASGDQMPIHVDDAVACAFEATSNGDVVIANGWAEIDD
jgi:hypothetical protein